jgi:hypothetical protein
MSTQVVISEWKKRPASYGLKPNEKMVEVVIKDEKSSVTKHIKVSQ